MTTSHGQLIERTHGEHDRCVGGLEHRVALAAELGERCFAFRQHEGAITEIGLIADAVTAALDRPRGDGQAALLFPKDWPYAREELVPCGPSVTRKLSIRWTQAPLLPLESGPWGTGGDVPASVRTSRRVQCAFVYLAEG